MSQTPADGSGPVGTGRVVAELGRPETPDETAARKAENSRKHRANQTTRNLVLALLASLAIVLFVVLVVPRTDNSAPHTVNYHSIAAQAQQGLAATLADPELPSSWKANGAELKHAGEKNQSWYIGFLTPKQNYIGLEQGIDAKASFTASLLGKAKPTGTVAIDGTRWTVYDQRTSGDAGNFEYSIAATLTGGRVVLHGSGTTSEFRTLAAAVADQLTIRGQ